MAAIKLSRTHRLLVAVVLAGAVVIATIGFVGSYAAVRDLAERKGFGEFSPFFPIGIDAGIVVLLALDLLLTWLRIPFPLLRQTAWLLTGATVAFNGAAAWGDPLAVGMHAIIPVLFIITVEAARHAIGRITDIAADRHMEGVRLWRWILAPVPTFRLWRRMKLWELRSYQQVIDLERDRLVYRAQLRARYGRAWRRRAPVEARLPLKLAHLGVPLEAGAARVALPERTEPAPAGAADVPRAGATRRADRRAGRLEAAGAVGAAGAEPAPDGGPHAAAGAEAWEPSAAAGAAPAEAWASSVAPAAAAGTAPRPAWYRPAPAGSVPAPAGTAEPIPRAAEPMSEAAGPPAAGSAAADRRAPGPPPEPEPRPAPEPAPFEEAEAQPRSRLTVPSGPNRFRPLGRPAEPAPAPAPPRRASGPADTPVGIPEDQSQVDAFHEAFRELLLRHDAFPNARQLARHLADKGIHNPDGSLLSEGYLRGYLRDFKDRHRAEAGTAV